jgi:FkbM family methyltransferase
MFISYAQNREDAILDAYFRDIKKGFYIDIGANHPIHDSVTKHFYMKGWHGINIEPTKSMFALLEEDRPNDINLNLGIADKAGELTLREYKNTGLSTFSDIEKKDYSQFVSNKTSKYKDVQVETITLDDLFEKYVPKGTIVHFLKIDVEGLEEEVIRGNNWKKHRPELICVEANRGKNKIWKTILINNKYQLVHFDGLNEYYLAEEAIVRKENFSYANDLLLNQQIMPYHVQEKISALELQVHNKAISNEIQLIHINQLQKEKDEAEKIILEQRRFKSTIKMFVKAFDKMAIARIEDLRKPRVKRRVNISSNRMSKLVTYDTSSSEALINTVRHNDLVSLYSTKPLKVKENVIIYKTVRFTYHGIRHVAKLPLKLLKRNSDKDES